ncbi:hypothetical protein CHS0354_022865 [Potamilus streckersoni]|uniref:Cation efflux protein transmembrane domain-containing protein n=1 Tax=Potamilus streckersoni TaxID=2493646 RepID=A0AAE0S258_9BIVA|nr:hypothetical protein CHS0354_022865 [Potamilus streckersoni]
MEERNESESTVQKNDPKETQSFGQDIIQTVEKNEDHVPVTVKNGISTNGQEDKKDTENDVMVDWRLPLGEFMSKRRGEEENGERISKTLRSFYKSQDKLIDAYKQLQDSKDVDDDKERVTHLRKQAVIYSKLTLFANVILLIIKLVAVILSGSISLICSLVDSSVDLASGLIIWLASRAVKRRKPYSYPQGRTKLEPIVIVILAVMMGITALELIKESVTKIIGFVKKTDSPPNMDFVTIGISIATVVIKLVLHLLCRRIRHPIIQALAKDHMNDVLSNSVAILFGYIGSSEMQGKARAYELVYVDPTGAILISLYIALNWWKTGNCDERKRPVDGAETFHPAHIVNMDDTIRS